jgi:hypothetical protein
MNKLGDLYSAYPALLGGFTRHWEKSVLPSHSAVENDRASQNFIVGLHSPIIFFFIHISHFFCPLLLISRSKSSLWTLNYLANQELFNFDGGGNRSDWKKPPVRDPFLKSQVPQVGIEPTLRTAIYHFSTWNFDDKF